MPVRIDRVETEMDVRPDSSSPPGGAPAGGGLAQMSDSELSERLRPIVLEIVEGELQRLRRELS